MDILEWLKSLGYQYTWGVKIGTRTPDIIAFRPGDEAVAFEFKRRADELSAAARQCVFYMQKVNGAYVVLPEAEARKVAGSSIKILKKRGIGLIGVNERVVVVLEMQRRRFDNRAFLEALRDKSSDDALFSPGLKNGDAAMRRLLDVVRSHPEGLPMVEVARLAQLHRHTATKYIYRMARAGELVLREVGPAKLCYPKGELVEAVKEREIVEGLRERL